ncbi:MAG: single-stranded DNA-binding protein, partial [Pseudomonadota bacterium]
KLQTRKWQDQNGNDRYTTEIIADQMQMLGGGMRNDSAGGYQGNQNMGYQQPPQSQPSYQSPPPGGQQAPQQKAPPQQAPKMSEPSFDYDDDIPF